MARIETCLSSVHCHVVVGPVSMPIRTVPGALDLTNKAIASGSDSFGSVTRLKADLHPIGGRDNVVTTGDEAFEAGLGHQW